MKLLFFSQDEFEARAIVIIGNQYMEDLMYLAKL